MTFAQIGAHLGSSRQSVYRSYVRGMRKLERIISTDDRVLTIMVFFELTGAAGLRCGNGGHLTGAPEPTRPLPWLAAG
jgi:hypothetical protein